MKAIVDKVLPYRGYGSFWERRFGGHVSLGPLVIYGFNAMHVALNLKTPWGWLCARPTLRVFGQWWGWYLYLSKDATPCGDACLFHFGHRS